MWHLFPPRSPTGADGKDQSLWKPLETENWSHVPPLALTPQSCERKVGGGFSEAGGRTVLLPLMWPGDSLDDGIVWRSLCGPHKPPDSGVMKDRGQPSNAKGGMSYHAGDSGYPAS